MTIDPDIVSRIKELGGSTDPEASSLQEFLLGTTFPHHLYDQDWDVYGVDEFFEENRAVYDNDVETFLDLIVQHYYSNQDELYGQDIWQPKLFTPFTPGTPDFEEWNSVLIEDADLSPIRAICGDGELQFVQILESYGYPDHSYVCLQDPEPQNPTVFGTDHEEFFQEISDYKRLSDLLNSYVTRDEFRQIIREYLDESASD